MSLRNFSGDFSGVSRMFWRVQNLRVFAAALLAWAGFAGAVAVLPREFAAVAGAAWLWRGAVAAGVVAGLVFARVLRRVFARVFALVFGGTGVDISSAGAKIGGAANSNLRGAGGESRGHFAALCAGLLACMGALWAAQFAGWAAFCAAAGALGAGFCAFCRAAWAATDNAVGADGENGAGANSNLRGAGGKNGAKNANGAKNSGGAGGENRALGALTARFFVIIFALAGVAAGWFAAGEIYAQKGFADALRALFGCFAGAFILCVFGRH